MEFPRKRAAVACTFCRHRKRKCDGQKPACGGCTSAGAQCEYQESTSDRSESDTSTEILHRLDRLESLVQKQTAVINTLSDQLVSGHDYSTVDTANYPNTSPSVVFPQDRRQSFNTPPVSLPTDCPALMNLGIGQAYMENDPILIPLGHQTPTGNLLGLEPIRKLIGHYSQDFFLLLESERKIPALMPRTSRSTVIERLKLDPAATNLIISNFFEHVHSQFPVLEKRPFLQLLEKFLMNESIPETSAALCLTVISLGEAFSSKASLFDMDISLNNSNSGAEYFAHAYQILMAGETILFARDQTVPLAFFHASLYFRYSGRPLQAWRLIHTASTGVQLIYSYLNDRGAHSGKYELLNRIAWGCYVLECDDLAEFHFPRSGIEILVEGLSFPEFTDPDERKSLIFLAMCSIRKLLNRIHNTMYSTETLNPENPPHQSDHTNRSRLSYEPSIASLETVNIELNRQLEAWFHSLPDSIKPDLRSPVPRDLQDIQLRTRYYAAKHIISRPCLVFAAVSCQAHLSDYVKANCETCVDSCRKLLHATVPLLGRRTHSTWLRLQALLAAVFVISMAKTTPSLSSLVPDFDELIGMVIEMTDPWARHHEAADAILSIFKTIRQKVRLSVATLL